MLVYFATCLFSKPKLYCGSILAVLRSYLPCVSFFPIPLQCNKTDCISPGCECLVDASGEVQAFSPQFWTLSELDLALIYICVERGNLLLFLLMNSPQLFPTWLLPPYPLVQTLEHLKRLEAQASVRSSLH